MGAAPERGRTEPYAPARDYGPTVTIFACDGTPWSLTRNSMYGPGGARLALAGPAARRVVAPVAVNVSGYASWLWLKAWVTDESRMRVPRRTAPASASPP